jgi:hypothetical protein
MELADTAVASSATILRLAKSLSADDPLRKAFLAAQSVRKSSEM